MDRMNKQARRGGALALALLLMCAALLSGCTSDAQEAPKEEPAVVETPTEKPAETPAEKPEEKPAETPEEIPFEPEIVFSTVDMDGGEWTEACFRGHNLTVVNLWAYWCGPCVGELPDLQKLSEEYASRGVQVIGLYDEWEEPDDIDTVNRLGITYPCLRYADAFDPWMDTGYIPVTIFVDGSGKVLGEAYIGSRDYDGWAAEIEKYLS